MPISSSQAQQKYLTAVKVLFDIGASINTTPALRRAAKNAILVLSHDFINQRIESIDLRNKQIELFIGELEKVIVAADGVTPFSALTKLTELADATTQMFEEE